MAFLLAVATSCSGGSSGDDPAPDNGGTTVPTASLTTVSYTSTDDQIFNPERGLYTEFESNLTDAVNTSRLQGLKTAGKSLVQIIYYIKDYRNADLPESGLQKLSRDMANVRKVGLKAILRFAYTSAEDEPDAPLQVILRHLDQLKPFFTENEDVIACTQAGFIGSWGEWYYTTNNLNNVESRRQVIDKWLSVLPADRTIQLRVQTYKKDYLGSSTPLSDNTAWKGDAASRLGHHNDAFMSDEQNMGTYISGDIKADKVYIAQEGLYVPIGGETCLPYQGAPISSGSAAVADLQSLHWSFLNDAYDTNVLNSWKKDGVWTRIVNGLGYRIVLLKGQYSDKHAPGSTLTANLTLQNVGFAPMYNARDVKLVLRGSDGKEYVASLNEDPRTWRPNRTVQIKAEVALPATIAQGSYKLFLWLPDPKPTIASRVDYAVRLANKGTWKATTGYNDLDYTVVVGKAGSVAASTSSVKFTNK